MNHFANVRRTNLGVFLLGCTPSTICAIILPMGLPAIQFENGAVRLPQAFTRLIWANTRFRRGVPLARLYWSKNSYLSLAMSTPDSHSDLHALHSKHRSMAS